MRLNFFMCRSRRTFLPSLESDDLILILITKSKKKSMARMSLAIGLSETSRPPFDHRRSPGRHLPCCPARAPNRSLGSVVRHHRLNPGIRSCSSRFLFSKTSRFTGQKISPFPALQLHRAIENRNPYAMTNRQSKW